jgi:hypothetical protein
VSSGRSRVDVVLEQLDDPGDETPGCRSPVCGVFRISLGKPRLLADRLEQEDACEKRGRCEDKRRAVKRQSQEQDEKSAVDGVTCAGVDARGSKRRSVPRSRHRCERRSERYPGHDQKARAGRLEHEPDYSKPGITIVGPGRADDGARDPGDNDDRLKDDPAFSASSQRRGNHRTMVRLVRPLIVVADYLAFLEQQPTTGAPAFADL